MGLIFGKYNIVEGNKLIAEFLGYEYVPFNNTDSYKPGYWHEKTPDRFRKLEPSFVTKTHNNYFLCRRYSDLRYFNSWDWLMEAVDYLEKLGYKTSFKTNYVRINPKEGNYDEVITYVGYGGEGHYVYRYLDNGKDYIHTDLFRGKEDINKRQAVWVSVTETIKYINSQN